MSGMLYITDEGNFIFKGIAGRRVVVIKQYNNLYKGMRGRVVHMYRYKNTSIWTDVYVKFDGTDEEEWISLNYIEIQ